MQKLPILVSQECIPQQLWTALKWSQLNKRSDGFGGQKKNSQTSQFEFFSARGGILLHS